MNLFDDKIYAVTIKQPAASLIIAGGQGWSGWKDVENRNWYCNHRGLLLIHASASNEHQKFHEDEDEYDECREGSPLPHIDDLPLGVIIGAVQMVDCYKANKRKPRSDWEYGPWCWKFAEPVMFQQPVKAKGQLGLWVPSNDIIDQLIHELER
jgi:hypothetical protein